MRTSTHRTALVGLALLPVALAAARPAAAAAPTVRVPQLTAAPGAVQPGDAVTLAGRGFPRNADIVLMAGPPQGDAHRIGSAHTGRRGRFVAAIRIRRPSDPGRFVARACHDGCRVEASVPFRIVAAR
jgi:hypothetical protein